MQIDIKNFDNFYLNMFSWLLVMPVLQDFFFVVCDFLGLSGVSSFVSAVFYIATLLVTVAFGQKKIVDLFILAAAYLPFFLNYLIFTDTRSYLGDMSMVMVYLFFLPFAVLIPLKINDWSRFFERFFPFAVSAVVLSALNLHMFREGAFLNYMDFSYSLLPAVCAIYCFTRIEALKKKEIVPKVIAVSSFVIGAVEIFAYGARASFLFLLMMIYCFEMLYTSVNFTKKIGYSLFFLILSLLFVLFQNEIFGALSSISLFDDSRMLAKLVEADLLKSEGRQIIYDQCVNRISIMEFDILGILGDRPLFDFCYPHNFFYEVLISYGWLFGCIFIISLFAMFFRALIKYDKAVCLFLLFSLFMRFCISGSYVVEMKFWLFLFALISINRNVSFYNLNRKNG